MGLHSVGTRVKKSSAETVTYLADRQANRKAIANIGLDQHVPWDMLKQLKAHQPRNWQYLVSERASHLAGGYPVVRQQLGQGAGLLRRQAHEHILQVGVRIVSVQAG